MIHLLQEKDKKQKSMRPRIDKNRFQQILKGILFFYKTPERLIIKKILPLSVGEGGGEVTIKQKEGQVGETPNGSKFVIQRIISLMQDGSASGGQ